MAEGIATNPYVRREPSASRQVNRMKDELDLFNFGVVVCDECHYLKNQRAARTKVRYCTLQL